MALKHLMAPHGGRPAPRRGYQRRPRPRRGTEDRALETALITDLDNTLFDWVEIWFNCFSPMLTKLAELSAIPKEKLIPEIAAVHQKHGTSEHALLIDELPSLRPLRGVQPAKTFFAPAIEVYREERRKWLKLFPTVAETLLKIKGRGTIIVGYTESMAFYSNYRLLAG